jgi:hypothetical protein
VITNAADVLEGKTIQNFSNFEIKIYHKTINRLCNDKHFNGLK